jgi:hypothetical protein
MVVFACFVLRVSCCFSRNARTLVRQFNGAVGAAQGHKWSWVLNLNLNLNLNLKLEGYVHVMKRLIGCGLSTNYYIQIPMAIPRCT